MNSTPSKRRLVLLGVGAAVILAGTLLPRILTLPALESSPGTAESPLTPLDNLSPEWRTFAERGLIGLSVVTLVGVSIAAVLRRRHPESSADAPKLLNVTATLVLPHHCCAFLIEASDRVFLAGTDAGGVRTLIALPAPPTADEEAPPPVPPARLLEVHA
jgi:hypothetical protein